MSDLTELSAHRVLVSGYRNWKDEASIRRELNRIEGTNIELIHGGCKGVDMICDRIAREKGWKVHMMKADWKRGRCAGPIRNQEMITEFKPTIALVFLHPDSIGTRDCLRRLQKYKLTNPIDIRIIHY